MLTHPQKQGEMSMPHSCGIRDYRSGLTIVKSAAAKLDDLHVQIRFLKLTGAVPTTSARDDPALMQVT